MIHNAIDGAMKGLVFAVVVIAGMVLITALDLMLTQLVGDVMSQAAIGIAVLCVGIGAVLGAVRDIR